MKQINQTPLSEIGKHAEGKECKCNPKVEIKEMDQIEVIIHSFKNANNQLQAE